MQHFSWYALIPLVSIVGGLGVGAIAILADHRRKQALLEERRLMIEKGMVPPPVPEQLLADESPAGTPRMLESSLRTGILTLFTGLGLIAAFLVLRYVVPGESFLPPRVASLVGPAGALVSLIGIGNLVYYRLARDRSTSL